MNILRSAIYLGGIILFLNNSTKANSCLGNVTPFRPQYHFSPQKGFMNDPNGLFYYNGIYHMFFQHYDFPNKSWGHATSTDLLHWTEHKDALVPQDGFQAFSGSAVVDHNNTSGLQVGEHPPIVAIFTSWGNGQHLAYSNDGGWTWERYGKVLSLPSDEKKSFPLSARDPMVFWHKQTGKWVMVIYQNFDQNKEGKAFGFYTSPNLKDWKYESRLPGFYVCPDLFELPVEGENDLKKWVILDWDRDKCKYSIGEFDGKKFTAETGPLKLVYGKRSHAATQTWKQAPDGDNRIIQIVNEWKGQYPGEPFQNQMSIPLELKLRRTPEGLRLCRIPIEEISSLYTNTKEVGAFKLKKGETELIPIKTRSFSFSTDLDMKKNTHLAVEVLGHPINVYNDSIVFDGFVAKLPGTKINQIKVLADIASIEVFVNDGEISMLYLMDPPDKAKPLKLTLGKLGSVSFSNFKTYDVKSTLKRTTASNEKEQDILIADFEGDDFQGWEVTGTAFGNSPLKIEAGECETLGVQGQKIASSLVGVDGKTGPHHQGKLTSPEFEVKRDYITFLIAGGKREVKGPCVKLLKDGKIKRVASAFNNEEMQEWIWDVKNLKGQKVQIQLHDSTSTHKPSHWGYIAADHFVQTDHPSVNPDPIFRAMQAVEKAVPLAKKTHYGRFIISARWHSG